MKKNYTTLFILLTIVQLPVFAISFNKLSQDDPVKLAYINKNESLCRFNLKLTLTDVTPQSFYIKIDYIIEKDTLTDIIHISGDFDKDIKDIYLFSNEIIKANLYLCTQDLKVIDQFYGKFTYTVLTPEKNLRNNDSKINFIGSIWHYDNVALFNINKNSETENFINLSFKFSDSFCFDVLYIKIKIITPEEEVKYITKEVNVNKVTTLPLQAKEVSINLNEAYLNYEGKYYIQVSHQMIQDRINGIDAISCSLVRDVVRY